MASIELESLRLEYPVYGVARSFRKEIIERATGGLIGRDPMNNGVYTVRALDDISFTMSDGDRVGIVGQNGAGKSTLLKVLAGIYRPALGRISVKGKVSTLFNISPGVDMDDTGLDTIRYCGMLLGLRDSEIEANIPEIIEFSELGEFIHLPVRTYSSGMLVRLCFALATSIHPEILLLDEGLGAGDARFAERAKARVDNLINRASIMVLASHSDELIRSLCNKAILLQSGKLLASGPVDEVIDRYHELISKI